MKNSKAVTQMPWYYVDSGNAPFPFVVVFDIGFMQAITLGVGEQGWVFWCLGYQKIFYVSLVWAS